MMPNVVLIGDSIRMGYQEVVRRELAGVAEIWAPVENGEDSANVLAHLDAWVIARQPALVHLNCGLHDLKTPFGAEARQVSLADYAANLRAIIQRIRTETSAVLLWATTTPVNEARHHAEKPFDRFAADVVQYNATALAIAREYGLPVNDLYSLVMRAGRDALLLADGVHYTPAGCELLGQAVARMIRRHLSSAPVSAR